MSTCFYNTPRQYFYLMERVRGMAVPWPCPAGRRETIGSPRVAYGTDSDACHVALVLPGEEARGASDAAADVQDGAGLGQGRHVEQKINEVHLGLLLGLIGRLPVAMMDMLPPKRVVVVRGHVVVQRDPVLERLEGAVGLKLGHIVLVTGMRLGLGGALGLGLRGHLR